MEAKEKRTTSMRVTPIVIEQARIAAGFRGESITQYVCRVVLEAVEKDIDEFRRGPPSPPAKTRKPKE